MNYWKTEYNDVKAKLENFDGYTTKIWSWFDMDPSIKKNKRFCKRGALYHDATIEGDLINIGMMPFRKLSENLGCHLRLTLAGGQSKSGAVHFHAIGSVLDEDINKFNIHDSEMSIESSWRHCNRSMPRKNIDGIYKSTGCMSYIYNGNAIQYAWSHHKMLLINEPICPRVKKSCRKNKTCKHL